MQTPQSRKEREVWQTCDDLLSMGVPAQKINADMIGKRLIELGYRYGSLTYLYKYRKSWKQDRGIEENGDEETLKVLSDPITRAASLVREEIQAEALETINAIKAETQEKIETLNQSLTVKQEAHDVVLEKVDGLHKEMVVYQKAHQDLQQSHIGSQQQLAVKTSQLEFMTEQNQQIKVAHDKQLATLKELHVQRVNALETQLQEHKHLSNQEIKSLKESHEQQRHQRIVEIDALKMKNQTLEKQCHVTELSAGKLSATNEVLKTQLDRLETELTKIKQENKSSNENHFAKLRELSEKDVEIKQLSTTVENTQEKHQQALNDTLLLKEEIGSLKAELRHTKNKDKEFSRVKTETTA